MIPYVIIAVAAVIGLAVNGPLGALAGAGLGSLGCAILGSVVRATEGRMDRRIRDGFLRSFLALHGGEAALRFSGLSDNELIAKVARGIDAIAAESDWGSAGSPLPNGRPRPTFDESCRNLWVRMSGEQDKWLVVRLSMHMAAVLERDPFVFSDWQYGKAARRAGEY